MTRREQRDSIVRIIFRTPFYPKKMMEEQTEAYIQELRDEPEELLPSLSQPPEEEELVYIREKAEAIRANLRDIDSRLEDASREWKLNRVGKMELAILRVAAYEILYDEDIPDKVAINEALELSKQYCDEKAAPFINGVLNHLLESK